MRWFDGQHWGAFAPPPPPQKKPTSVGKVLLIVVGLVLAIVLISQCGGGNRDRNSEGSSASSTSRSTTTARRTPTSTVPPGPSPQDLDPASYSPINARDFAILVKNPDAAIGRKIIVYGVVTQFDAATGRADFRANTAASPSSSQYDYDQNTMVHVEDPRIVANVVEDDMVTLYAEVAGSVSYDTTIGGNATAPQLTAYIVEVTGTAG